MHSFTRPLLASAALGFIAFASIPSILAFAHEAHRMECKKVNIQAMNADIQAMNDGETKTSAMKEMEIAEEMMAKQDMKACATHMRNAMEVMEK